jgi:hypothetical protein
MSIQKELCPSASTEEADEAQYDLWLTIPRVAAGVTMNQARAKLRGGDWLAAGEPIVFTIASGSAVFEGGLKTTTATTDSFGCAFVAFTDAGADSGEMNASMRSKPNVGGSAPYAFTGGGSSGFNLAVSSVTDDQPADGKADDQGRALVSYGGGKLQDRQNVQFAFGAGASAVFETTGPYVQAGSTGTKLIVKTRLDENGNDIADAGFHDTVAENVTLVATLVDHPEAPPGTHDFTFAVAQPTFNVDIKAIKDGQPADGSSDDQGRAVVTYGGGELQDRHDVQFVFGAGASALFETTGPDVQTGSTDTKLIVRTHLDENGNDIADACFHDAQAESVTLIATLVDHPEVPGGKKDFAFSAISASFDLAMSVISDDLPADGTSADQGRAVVTENGGALQAPKIVKFTFDSGASARFDTTKPAGYVQPNSSATVLYVKTHFDNDANKDIADAYFTDCVVEAVALTASLADEPQTQPRTQEFQFTARSAYSLDFSSMTPDGVPSDGISENMGRANVWGPGLRLPIPQTVKFQLLGEGTFDLRGAYVLPGSDGSTLYVKTHYDRRQGDVAYAYFTGISSEATSVRASLLYLPAVQPRTVDFQFNVPPFPYAISLRTDTLDGVPADGYSANRVQAIVTKGGKAMGTTDVTFAVDAATGARFDTGQPYVVSSTATTVTVRTYVDGQGRDIAQAIFRCVNPGMVKLTATFPEYGLQGTPPAWRYFLFTDTGDEQN